MGRSWPPALASPMTHPTRPVNVSGVQIGGGAPITVQSMTDTDTRDVAATVAQIDALEEAGCDIVRVAVPDMEAAEAIGRIKSQIAIPLVADIHFDYRLALAAIDQGADKLRINPGNLRRPQHVEAVAAAAAQRGIPIRVGVNSGSVPEDVRARHEGGCDVQEQMAAAMVDAALGHLELLEKLDFTDVVVSLKAFDLRTTWSPTAASAASATTPFTSASPRPASRPPASPAPPSASRPCFRKASEIPSASLSPATLCFRFASAARSSLPSTSEQPASPWSPVPPAAAAR